MITQYTQKLYSFYDDHKRMPTYSEMLTLFDFKSKNAVYRVVKKLIDAGIVAKDRLGRLIPSNTFSEIPMLGLVKAGFPSIAEEAMFDTLDIESFLVKKKDVTFMLKVDGDSMIDAHIADGDLVLVERTNKASDRAIVIAEIDGEFTMKYFREKGGKVWLEPANKDFPAMHPRESLNIHAVVKAVIRKY